MSTRNPARAASSCPVLAACALAALAACSSSSSSPDAGTPDSGAPDSGPVDAGPLLHVASPAWQEQIIYFILTDRFANGDPSNDDQKGGEYDPTNYDKYSGGDLQGIIDKLDYIQGLGATAIWITPPVANQWWDPLAGSAGYHGYWARDLKKVDEHLGTLDTYKALSDALHRRGMYLIQDVVPNHMGNYRTYRSNCGTGGTQSCWDPNQPAAGLVLNSAATPGPKPTQAPFDQIDPSDPAQLAAAIYHWTPAITDYGNQDQLWNWQISDLDDLNSENPVVRRALKDSYGYWIREVGVDGFRVDTVKFVPHDFWSDFFWSTSSTEPGIMAQAQATGRSQFLAFGEVANTSNAKDDTADRYCGAYTGTAAKPELPAVLAYPLWADIGRVFAQGTPTSDLTYRLGKLMDGSIYPNPYLMPTFIDNHDQARFLKSGSGAALLQVVPLLFTLPGIPTLYYGTELGFTETRAAMFPGGWDGPTAGQTPYNTNIGMYKIVRALADLRKANKVLSHGTLDVLYDSDAGAGPLVYRRQYQGSTVLVVFNTADSNVLVSNLATQLPTGAVLELWHSENVSAANRTPPAIGQGGITDVVLEPRAALVLHATTSTVTPPAPGAVLTVDTAIDGQTFSKDVVLSGTVTPAATRVKMVLDGYLDTAADAAVDSTGHWTVTLPISTFPLGTKGHSVAFWAPDAKVSTPRLRFTSSVVFSGKTISVDDPQGDDHGPGSKSYTYPTDSTFAHQDDILNTTYLVGPTTLQLVVTMFNMTQVWGPDYGFDHVVFNVFFSLPGASGGTNVMPNLFGTTPAGFNWNYWQFSSGWAIDNSMYSAAGATDKLPGTPVTPASVSANAAAKTVTFTYDRRTFGLASWNGVQVYVTTWDYDGVNKVYRPLSPAGGPYTFGNGAATDPRVMDDVAPVTLTDH
jgi:glycosidase